MGREACREGDKLMGKVEKRGLCVLAGDEYEGWRLEFGDTGEECDLLELLATALNVSRETLEAYGDSYSYAAKTGEAPPVLRARIKVEAELIGGSRAEATHRAVGFDLQDELVHLALQEVERSKPKPPPMPSIGDGFRLGCL